jgi:DNA polymerase elongation subunit (family B)
LLSTLFDCKDVNEILNKGYENALLLVTKAMDKIMIGGDDVTKNDLVISKLLGQNIEKYRSSFPHASAAILRISIPLRVILSDRSIQTHSTKILFVEF